MEERLVGAASRRDSWEVDAEDAEDAGKDCRKVWPNIETSAHHYDEPDGVFRKGCPAVVKLESSCRDEKGK